ncbi:MAG TPA: RHS repeat-associated core domain-containing protein, partial [Pirellula sp.]|nr:RHS repeat-associated core domain-containing protein [Pirellula sp.]
TNALGNTASYTYDENANVLSETDTLGNTVRFTYDLAGRRLTATGPTGVTSKTEYDEHGRPRKSIDGLGNVIVSTFNERGRLTSTTNQNGDTQLVSYDEHGWVLSATDALGHTTTFTNDANGRKIGNRRVVSTPSGSAIVSTTYIYDASDRLVQETGPDGQTKKFEYDASGRLIVEMDALGNRSTRSYDARGQLVTSSSAIGIPTKFEYNTLGLVNSTTDGDGNTIANVYDSLGRIIETVLPDSTPQDSRDNPRFRKVYDSVGQLISETDSEGNRTENTYDAAGRRVKVRDALGGESIFAYDANGNKVSETDPLGHTTRYVFDELGRIVQAIFADGSFVRTAYNDGAGSRIIESGDVRQITDEEGNTTQYTHDRAGRIATVEDALGNKITYLYNEAGNLISERNALGQTTRYEFDFSGRRTATILPLAQRSTRSYDAAGQLVESTNFNGQQIRYSYDLDGKVVSKLLQNSSVSYAYNPRGAIDTVNDSRGMTKYKYDAFGRTVSVTQPDGDGQVVSYEYDQLGRRVGVTSSAGIVRTTFDSLGRQSSIRGPDGGLTRFVYDKASNLVRTELPNNVAEVRTYDSRNRLLSVETSGSSGLLSGYRYTLSPSGKRISVLDVVSGQSTSFAYDRLGRLISERTSSAATLIRQITYSYDPVGNRLQRNDSVEGITDYVYDTNGRLSSKSLRGVITSFVYDSNGNELSRTSSNGDMVINRWDSENRLVATDVTKGTSTQHLAYRYDAAGNRTARALDGATTNYLVDTQGELPQVIMEYLQGGVATVVYVRADRLLQEIRNGESAYFLVDGQGSTMALANTQGVVTKLFAYDGFGRVLIEQTGVLPSFGFVGEQSEQPLGWTYLRARYYDPDLGRFVSRDPFEGFVTEPISREKYVYAHGDPVNNLDPTGQNIYGAGLAGLAGLFALYHIVNIGITFSRTSAASEVSDRNEQALQNSIDEAQRYIDQMAGATGKVVKYFFGSDIGFQELVTVHDNWIKLKNAIVPTSNTLHYTIKNVNLKEFTSQLKENVPADTIQAAYIFHSVIRFYPLYWDLPKNEENRTQVDVLIHELTHAVFFTTDSGSLFGENVYGVKAARRLKSAKAINNADNYALEALFVNVKDIYTKRTGDPGPG